MRLIVSATVFCSVLVSGSSAFALPVAGQISVVGVYNNTVSAFGIAYDSVNDVIHYTQGDAGDDFVHTVKAFKNYTALELAGFGSVTVDGDTFPSMTLVEGQHDVAGITSPGGLGGSGVGAHFSALAFNTATGQLVQTSNADVRAYDPFTAAGQTTIPGVGAGFADGLDLDGANRWFSPDVGDIFNNSVLTFDNAVLAHTDLGVWAGLGGAVGFGWSGTEQVGDSLFAVAVQDFADSGRSRTIVRFDITTGQLVGYDPDGHLVASRWEDLAYDGRYLYAADLRGDLDGNGVQGDIYVFDVGGGLNIPEPSSFLLVATGVIGLSLGKSRRRTAGS
jgi:hypothetical protein